MPDILYKGAKDLGTHLRRRRIQSKLTQPELAQLVNLTPASISRYELGIRVPTLGVLIKIATALNCDLIIELQKPIDEL